MPQKILVALLLVCFLCIPARPAFASSTALITPAHQQANQDDCLINGFLPFLPSSINICTAIAKVWQGLVLDPLQNFLQETTQQANSILWQTPALTSDTVSGGLTTTWGIVLAIVDALIGLVVIWGGIKMILGRKTLHAILSYANALELIPRVILSVLAAHFSLHFIQILINGNNALCSVFAQDHQLIGLVNKDTGLGFTQFLQFFYALMGLLLLLEAIARDALLSVLIVLSPAWLFAWALPETQGLARLGTTATIALVFMQALQLLTMDVGGHMIATFIVGSAAQFSLLNVLGGLVVLYVTLQLPAWLGRWVLHSTSFLADIGDATAAAAEWIMGP